MPFPLLPLRARVVAAPVLLCLTVLAACTRTDLLSTTEPVTGPGVVYTLVSVDSRTLPATVTVESTQYRVSLRGLPRELRRPPGDPVLVVVAGDRLVVPIHALIERPLVASPCCAHTRRGGAP